MKLNELNPKGVLNFHEIVYINDMIFVIEIT
jgi:hypothetical protein